MRAPKQRNFFLLGFSSIKQKCPHEFFRNITLATLLFILGFFLNGTNALLAATTLDEQNETEEVPERFDLEKDFIAVSDINNSPDSDTGLGRCNEIYRLSKYDVTAAQYCAFLNAVASRPNAEGRYDVHGLFHKEMEIDQNVKCLVRTFIASECCYHYTVFKGREHFPITYVSWYDSLRFCNWLQHGQPLALEVNAGTTETGAYQICQSVEGQLVSPSAQAAYFLPNQNQWYKAAYYQHELNKYCNYPAGALVPPGNNIGNLVNQANWRIAALWGDDHCVKEGPPYVTPVGSFTKSLSPYGAYDMGGNVAQWIFDIDASGNALARGGSWKSSSYYSQIDELQRKSSGRALDPSLGYNDVGFRVATSARETDKKTLAQSDEEIYKPSPLHHDLENLGEATEWTILNVGGEIVEAVVFQQLGLYAFLPYCAYMGAVTLYQYANREYYAAAATLLHAAFDITCMLGNRIGFDVAGILCSGLERSGLKCVADFFGRIHEQMDQLLHCLGIEHAHAGTAKKPSPLIIKKLGDELKELAEGEVPTALTVTSPINSTSTSSVSLAEGLNNKPGFGWTKHSCKKETSCCLKSKLHPERLG